MAKSQIQRYRPDMYIDKTGSPVIFIDTYMWGELISGGTQELQLLKHCCDDGIVTVAITNVIAAELSQRNYKLEVERICGAALVQVPVGRITGNQVVKSLLHYKHQKSPITFEWDSAIWEVPVLENRRQGLGDLVTEFKNQLNAAIEAETLDKRRLIGAFVQIEQKVWHHNFKAYGDILDNEDPTPGLTYDGYFQTDYFADLPAIILKSYWFAYLLNERRLKSNDVIDVYTIAELLPYSIFYTMDADQHARLKKLQNHYPPLFSCFDRMGCIASRWKYSEVEPMEALHSLLTYLQHEQQTNET